ncbi:MAG TPA: NAD(P)/FAD-dependent oxidoreductase [Tepidisphaeraceae bacterium]|jgi:flavin-dependent dehydrogenase|nr:NAD(P)/FAD-dependent oxidoreductase [Tepidisphaeraceae bacterium]
MSALTPQYDVVIVGGGPGGATAAMVLARAGKKAVVLEKTKFPRFHIGESFLPRNFPLIQELGLEEQLKALPHVPKFGAEFGMGNEFNSSRFTFRIGLLPGSPTFNIERAVFDDMLLKEARKSGAEVRENVTVRKIVRMRDGDVAIATDKDEITGKYLFDASGQSTLVGKHLGTRRPHKSKHLQRIAYFQHFEGVKRLAGEEAGHPAIFMSQEGWFWVIPINDQVTSVGLVMDAEIARSLGVPANQILQWGIERCPVVRDRCANATGPKTNEVIADFSYMCKPYAGDGHFLLGDAAAFMDPIFSSGATLAMMGASEAANRIIEVLDGKISADTARKKYIRLVEGSTSIFFGLIRDYYTHSFRELFLNGQGPLNVHGAVISILAGQVFPKPAWALVWRLWFFRLCMFINRFYPLVPKKKMFSLREEQPVAPEERVQNEDALAPAT